MHGTQIVFPIVCKINFGLVTINNWWWLFIIGYMHICYVIHVLIILRCQFSIYNTATLCSKSWNCSHMSCKTIISGLMSISIWIFHRPLHSTGISICSHSISNEVLATKVCTYQDSHAVVIFAKLIVIWWLCDSKTIFLCNLNYEWKSLMNWTPVMMTSWNGNICRVTGQLWEEFPGEFPSQRPLMHSFDVFFDLYLNKWLSKQPRRRWFKTPSHLLCRHCNGS